MADDIVQRKGVMSTMDLGNEPRGWDNPVRRHATTITWISIALIVASLLLIARQLPIGAMLEALQGTVAGLGIWGPVVYGLVYVVAVVLMAPASVLTLAAGALFGLLAGTITVSLASTTGAALAFLISRYLARDAVDRKLRGSPKFAAVDRAVSENGWKIVAMLRLSPAVPFNIQNYLYGLTGIRFWPYVLASWIAMLPGTFLYVYLGYIGRAGLEAASSGETSRTPGQWAFLVVGLLATIAVTIYVTRLARRAMSQQDEFVKVERHEPEATTEPEPKGWPWGATVAALLAVAMVAAAGVTQVKPTLVADVFKSLGGPPQVTLTEAYEASPEGPSFDHSAFDGLVKAHVRPGGWVDYPGLLEDSATLDAYIERLADAPFESLGRDEKLAFLINAYNAFTLKLILEHFPTDSIKSIPADQRWDAQRWRVASNTWSLNQIEHEQIRPNFREPRIHFALVCAAVGCPPLRAEAYSADRLEEQLEDQARYVHAHPRWFQWDGGEVLGLTSLYNWYGGDFEQVAGSVLAFAARYVPELSDAIAAERSLKITWLDYDWSLNSTKNQPEETR